MSTDSQRSCKQAKVWYLYVVKCADDSLYTGVTTDLCRRLYEHNNTSKAAKYTRSRRPVKVVYWVQHKDRSSAQKAEAAFKKLARIQKLAYIESRNCLFITSEE